MIKSVLKLIMLILLLSNFIYGCSSKNNASKVPIKITTDGRFTILIFDSTTCPYCKELHNDLNTNKELKEYTKNMKIYYIHVNKNHYYTIPTKKGNLTIGTEILAQTFGFRGSTPFIVITDKNLKPIVTIPGYVRPPTMIKILKYVLSRAYKTMSVEEYLSTP